MITDRLQMLRQKMKDHGISALILPTSDFHDTEYVCDYFGARKHFSGFTGSAGVLVVLPDKAGLWTDGRYFIQAAKQLEGSGIDLMKMGMPGTPEIKDYIIDALEPGQKAAFDGRCVSMQDFEAYQDAFGKHGIEVVTDLDLAGEAWPDRPELPASQTFHYDEKYAGKSVKDKLAQVRKAMKEAGASHHVLSKIDEVAWLYNLRADDIPSFPVALAYSILDDKGGVLYINDNRLDDQSRQILKDNNIAIKDYDAIYGDVKALEGPVLMEKDFINSQIGRNVKEAVWGDDPIQLMKACKNPVEVEGFREAHRRDAVAMIRFWKWLEEELAAGNEVTEISAKKKLTGFRAEQPEYVEDSFETIAAYGPNAAMAHYQPDENNPVKLENKGFFLVDSGGHYLPGTTDITRTFVLGDLTDEERAGFTNVLRGHINLAKAIFLKGGRGMNLDILAREPLWAKGQDYNHGTGHGVGCLLSVHEGPNGFRWKIVPERKDSCILEEGMVTSDEPGLYEEGKFGIRHENLLVTQPAFSSEYGDFLKHDVLTLVPFDVRGLDLALMSPEEIDWLNDYHKQVYDTIAPRLSAKEADWLAEKTAPVSK